MSNLTAMTNDALVSTTKNIIADFSLTEDQKLRMLCKLEQEVLRRDDRQLECDYYNAEGCLSLEEPISPGNPNARGTRLWADETARP